MKTIVKYTNIQRLMYMSYAGLLSPAQTQKLFLFVLHFREFYQQQVCLYINFKCSASTSTGDNQTFPTGRNFAKTELALTVK